jgi:hypothetical protein
MVVASSLSPMQVSRVNTRTRSASLIVLGVRQQAKPGTDHRWEVIHRVACEAYCPVLIFGARYFE